MENVWTDAGGRVLLVHQTYGPRKWDLPGGILDSGEAPWECARRETREELGLESAKGYTGVLCPDGVEIGEAAFFAPDALPSPLSDFARERILDAVADGSKPLLRVQHRREC